MSKNIATILEDDDIDLDPEKLDTGSEDQEE